MPTPSTAAIQSRLEKEQITHLQEIANRKGISLSLLIRLILIDYLAGVNNGK